MAGTGSMAGGKCPICKEPTAMRYRPFCSKRCAEIDLSRWFGGKYAVPVAELDESDLDDVERFVEGGGVEFGDDDDSSGERD